MTPKEHKEQHYTFLHMKRDEAKELVRSQLMAFIEINNQLNEIAKVVDYMSSTLPRFFAKGVYQIKIGDAMITKDTTDNPRLSISRVDFMDMTNDQ